MSRVRFDGCKGRRGLSSRTFLVTAYTIPKAADRGMCIFVGVKRAVGPLAVPGLIRQFGRPFEAFGFGKSLNGVAYYVRRDQNQKFRTVLLV